MKSKLILSVICVITGLAETAQAADKWLSVRSRNFSLVGNASESAMRRVGRNLEEFRSAFVTLFPGIAKESSVETIVLVFKDQGSFRPYKPLYQGKPANVAGYFQPGPDVNFIALTGDSETPKVIFHEYVHSLTKDGKFRLPVWVSEGIADFYSTLATESGGKEVLVGRIVEEHIVTLNQLPLIPLQTLFEVQYDSPYYNEKSKQGVFYAQSWALVHYLMLTKENQREGELSKYLAALGSGKSVDDSFREAFQTDYPVVERELRDYMKGRVTWPAVRVKLDDKLDFEKDMQVTPLSEGRAQFYLGDLMVHTNRLAEAETPLQTAMKMEPSFADSYASMGLLRMRQEKRDEALRFLGRAVELDSQNHLTHYHYASLLYQESIEQGDDADRADKDRLRLMRTHLKRSIELAPRFMEAYGMLSYVNLVLADELVETEALLKKAILFAPSRQELSLDLAQIMLARNESLAARALLAPLANSSDDVVHNRAAMLLDRIAQHLQYEEEFRAYEQRKQAFIDAGGTFDTADIADAADRELDELASEPSPEATALPPVPVRRAPAPVVEGLLTFMDCTEGLTLRIQAGNGRVELHTDDPSKIAFNSNVAAVKDSISCGAMNPPVPVEIKYRRTNDPRYLGEPVSVLFVDKK